MSVQQTQSPAEKDPLQLELDILHEFVGMVNPKDKKIVAKAKKLYMEKTNSMEKRLLRDIMTNPKPLDFVQHCVNVLGELNDMIPQFIEEGYHGAILKGDDIHPVRVQAPAHWLVREKQWSPDEEYEIQKKVLTEYMEAYDINHCVGYVMLLPNFGFSGVLRIIEYRRNPEIAA